MSVIHAALTVMKVVPSRNTIRQITLKIKKIKKERESTANLKCNCISANNFFWFSLLHTNIHLYEKVMVLKGKVI
jgi:hypothetical protein